jgi:aryl-alcohol dehydrogenase-like predicted oxidoreductase
MSQMALAWCMLNPNVSTVITGASRPEQVVENMAALDVVSRFTSEIEERIEGILRNKPKAESDFR